ncbi:MAG: HAMP domain-containing protein [Spirochaetota bacterium]
MIWLYAGLTVALSALFVFVVLENQLELINEAAILRSQLAGERLRRTLQIEQLSREAGRGLSDESEARIAREARALDISSLSLLSEDGVLLATVPSGERTLGEQAGSAEFRMINEALTRREFENRLFHHQPDRDARQVHLFIPVDAAGGEGTVAHAVVEIPQIDESLAYLARQIAIGIGLIMIANVLFWIVLWKNLFRPLESLRLGIAEITGGALDKRVKVERDDELGSLARAFNSMAAALNTMQERARGANPLTGLPGNVEIAEEIDRRLGANELFAVLYGDLDNFKAYNDAYGFSQGDRGILYTRDVLEQARATIESAVPSVLNEGIFIGHEGGDDFVAICPYEVWEQFATEITHVFDAGVAQFYSEEDRRRGYISSYDRQGNPQQFPFMSFSLAIVTNHHRSFAHHAELVEVAAEVKKVAKKIPGSSYAIDRRKAHDSQSSPQPALSPERGWA